MDCRVKRGFFEKCHDYLTSYLKETTKTDSDDDDSSGSSEEEEFSGKSVGPIFKLAGPYQKVATKDTSATTFSDSYSNADNWGGSNQSNRDNYSKSNQSNDWASNWNEADSQGWVGGGGSGVDPSTLAARAPKTAAAKAAQKIQPKKEDPLIDLGVKEVKKKDDWTWEEDAWESLSK